MKRVLIQFGTLLMAGMLVVGCQADNNNETNTNENEGPDALETMNHQVENIDKDTSEIVKGLDIVLLTINKLKGIVNNTPNDVKQINETGKTLEKNWDQIEKAVEKRNPELYEYIEKSLYPLIDEAKKATPNIDKIKPLIEDTTKKLQEYKEKISS